jgi:hypothetical protein
LSVDGREVSAATTAAPRSKFAEMKTKSMDYLAFRKASLTPGGQGVKDPQPEPDIPVLPSGHTSDES